MGARRAPFGLQMQVYGHGAAAPLRVSSGLLPLASLAGIGVDRSDTPTPGTFDIARTPAVVPASLTAIV